MLEWIHTNEKRVVKNYLAWIYKGGRLKKRSAVLVVSNAMTFRDVPRSLATASAVCLRNAGSHRFPRCGIGAKKGLSVSSMKLPCGTAATVLWRSAALGKVATPVKDTRKPAACTVA